ncbi:hypothetical protein [Nocardioides perillae]|uniref:DUF222 domain-containing protein n=1 Tax=Nocardioides perillae TaxID=1119534 RepID=A0A7Y9RXU1_9ACTN|nr:hypothetical protein [Nocardioides perillae]NYG56702.1 hypothetical protein [Nocardioides perillae]
MAASPVPEFESAAAVLDFAGVRARDGRAVEADLMLAACTWADLHPAADLLDAAHVAGAPDYFDRGLTLAGSHAPTVAEFAVAELAARMGRTTQAGGSFLGESLFARHLLPRLWERLQALEVDGWRVRLVARACLVRDLVPAAAAHVDRHLAPVAQTAGPVVLERLVSEAFARFMPEAAEAERERAEERRHFDVHCDGRTSDLDGTVDATGTFDLPDGLAIRDAVEEEKARLRALGAADQPGPLSAQALANLVARGSDGASAQGTLDLLVGDAEGPGGPHPGGRAASPGERVDTPDARPHGPRRRYLLHLHLSDLAVHGGGGGEIGRVEETRAPVTAATIREWLGAGATAQVTVLPVLDLGEAVHTEAYEVSTRLARRTALVHHTCVFPWCSRAARSCDHDHAVPFDPAGAPGGGPGGRGGPTCSCNIAPLCRTHHRLKTHGHAATRWTSTPAGDGAWLWRSPHGAHYLRDHLGTRPVDGPLATGTGPPDEGGTGPPGTGPPAPAD